MILRIHVIVFIAFVSLFQYIGISMEGATVFAQIPPPPTGPVFIKDINSDAMQGTESSHPLFLAKTDTHFFFVASSQNGFSHQNSSQLELWRSDGSEQGTLRLKTFADSSPYYPIDTEQVVANHNLIYFAELGTSLWRSDGTVSGTRQIDLQNRPATSYIGPLAMVNEGVYFILWNDTAGRQFDLWYVSHQSTVAAHVTTLAGNNPYWLTGVEDTLYFVMQKSDLSGHELWKSDGTAVGTVQLTSSSLRLIDLKGSNQLLYFRLYAFGGNNALWRSDGTVHGTYQLKEIEPRFTGETDTTYQLTDFNGTLIFVGDDAVHGAELWKSDGTITGTTLITDIVAPSSIYGPQILGATTEAIYFSTFEGGSHRIWMSDGSAGGTKQIGTFPPSEPILRYFSTTEGAVAFTKGNGTERRELWVSQGDAAMTVRAIEDLYLGDDNQIPPSDQLVGFGDKFYLTAHDGISGAELWSYNPHNGAFSIVKDINVNENETSFAPDDLQPEQLTRANEGLYFLAGEGSTSRRLWYTDGSLNGTMRINDLALQTEWTRFNHLTLAGERLFFTAVERVNESAVSPVMWLWVSDRTEDGTQSLMQADAIHSLTPLGNKITFFTTETGFDTIYWNLWFSDGSVTNTVQIRQMPANTLLGQPSTIEHDGYLYFSGNDPEHGTELWRSDGTDEGTILIRDIRPEGSASPRLLTSVGNEFYFVTEQLMPSTEIELWRSDGTATGTTKVKAIQNGSNLITLQESIAFNGMLYFALGDSDGRALQLWRSDGTEAGTKSIFLGRTGGASLYEFTTMGDSLYFIAQDQGSRRQIWKISNTDVDQALPITNFNVTELQPLEDTQRNFLTAVDDALFVVVNSSLGYELYVSNGKPNCILPAADIYPGSQGSKPSQLTNANHTLYFVADDGVHGQELWGYANPIAPTCSYTLLPTVHANQ